MKPWHYARIQIPFNHPWFTSEKLPFQENDGSWVFFYIKYLHDASKTPFRDSFIRMTSIGLNGVS